MFRTYEDVFFTVMSYFTKRNGKLRWVEKTPAHIFSVNQILSEFPDAVFVELVRDPRDVMSSIKIMEKKGMWGGRIRYNPFFATLSFKLFNLAGVSAKKKYPSKIIRIRYEDLIEKPEQTIREVCRFLGQTFESAMLNISHYIPSEISREKRSVFSKEPIGRYKSTLTPDEIALCQIFNRKEMITLNYNMIRIGWWHKLKIINLIIKSILDSIIRFLFDLKERRSLLLKTFLMRLGYLKSAKRLIQKFPNND